MKKSRLKSVQVKREVQKTGRLTSLCTTGNTSNQIINNSRVHTVEANKKNQESQVL